MYVWISCKCELKGKWSMITVSGFEQTLKDKSNIKQIK